ncbi:twitching motility protein PilT [Candidatus Thiomargarita nelsonii]|uniref:Twitching motility protein PilT n=1 Tax=Candidatus Thiomargarita nelsonii TaxID=1003181 RepID=A0A4E0QSG4_9GAMM|nr:twitching motility protein PilT [Candidatus Thiomargarita nelsonii]
MKKIWLDTHTFLWLTNELYASLLSKEAKSLFLKPQTDFYLSLASIWEMAIKVKIGKLNFPVSLREFISQQLPQNGIKILNIKLEHVIEVADLPLHHRDPFDRLIIAQALVENMQIVSVDEVFDDYGVQRLW